MKRISMGTLILAIYTLLVFYFGYNTYRWLQTWALPVHPVLFGLFWFVCAFGYIIGKFNHGLKYFSIIGSYWFIVMQYGLILFPLATLVYLILPSKQTIFITGNIVAFIFLIIFIAGTYMAFSPVIRYKTIHINKDSGSLRELKLVLASDFHLGLLSNKKHLQRFVNLANVEQPDVVLLAGDLVDDDPIWFVKDGMSEVMRQLKATYGVYGVVGNHEYYGRKIPLLVEEMRGAGVRMLLDETICVENAFYVTGREDATNGKRQSLESLKPKLNELPWLVMDHTPFDLDTPAELGVDVHVSGHTHRGQMWPNHLFTRRLFELDYGYKLKGQLHAFVSSGFGFWGPPLRLGSRSELWSIKITVSSK
ncbi:metallophosphoesterase [Paenisporosarcina sp. FSL H8-0542]|uniref:metallophosphoesterase n=1 Tax=Paenisporosarcina sp. FSL H8-0542 TaxID=2921401 RepID=UPI00315B158D